MTYYPGSRMLLDEHPIVILPSLAAKIGLNEAIVVQQLNYWLHETTKAKKQTHYRDGYYWVWNTYEDWHCQFPWWSTRTIRRILEDLEELGLVITANYNKMPMDKTKWYRIDYEVFRRITGEKKELEHPELQSGQNGQSENTAFQPLQQPKRNKDGVDKMASPCGQNGQTENTEIEASNALKANETSLDKMASPCGQNGQSMWTKWPDAYGQVVHSNNQRLHIDFNPETTSLSCASTDAGGESEPEAITVEVEVLPMPCEPPGKGESKKSRKKKGVPIGIFSEEDFECFWAATIWKTGKAPAKESFLKIQDGNLNEIVAAWERDQQFHLETKGTLQYLRRPVTWINQRGWEDESDPVYSSGMMPKTVTQSAKFVSNVERMREKYGEGYRGEASTKTLKQLIR